MSGLVNLGNTCYLNALLQCLIHMNELIPLINKPTNKLFIRELNDFFNLYKKNQITNPQPIYTYIRNNNNYFNNHLQHDSHEMFVYLIDKLNNYLKTKQNMKISFSSRVLEFKSVYNKIQKYKKNDKLFNKYNEILQQLKVKYINDLYIIKALYSWKKYFSNNYSELNNLLYGQLLSTMNCSQCNYSSVTFDVFNNLSLELKSNLNESLNDCLNNFVTSEYLDDDNLWKCSKCSKKVKASKKIMFWKLPKILIIHLKRFKYESNRNILKKNNSITCELNNLNLSDYISLYNSENKDNSQYKCFGIICHSGSYNSGHYYAYCRNNDQWTLFNDSSVKNININNESINTSGYIYFYRRIE